MVYVYDSSFIGALIIPDEKHHMVEKMAHKIRNEDEKYAPQLLWYETANIFNNLVRRKRYTLDDVVLFIRSLGDIRLMIDSASGPEYSEKLLRLANEYGLSSYDASYLELAGRKRAVLCTLDADLGTAAKRYCVAVLK